MKAKKKPAKVKDKVFTVSKSTLHWFYGLFVAVNLFVGLLVYCGLYCLPTLDTIPSILFAIFLGLAELFVLYVSFRLPRLKENYVSISKTRLEVHVSNVIFDAWNDDISVEWEQIESVEFKVVKSRYANNIVVLITIRDSGDVYEINGAHITLGDYPIDINHAIYRHCEEHNRTFGKPKILVKGIYF